MYEVVYPDSTSESPGQHQQKRKKNSKMIFLILNLPGQLLQVIETEVGVSGSSSDGGASVLIGAPEGCFEDKPGSRVFDIFSSGADVTVQV